MRESWYDTAQVCLNGHLITSVSEAQPEHKKEYCEKCGAPTITICQNCDTPIQGFYHIPRVWGRSHLFTPPAFCHACGQPYPWTESRLRAAQDLADEVDDLSAEEKETLKQSLDDLVRDTPQTRVAAIKFKKLASKAGREAAMAFREILIDIVSETARKMIWP